MKPCNHAGETRYMTAEQRYCRKCGKIYYYDPAPIDFKRAAKGKERI